MNSIDNKSITIYTVSDIQKLFGIGRTKAYELMSADGFPSFKINKRVYVEHGKLLSWLDKRAGKQFNF